MNKWRHLHYGRFFPFCHVFLKVVRAKLNPSRTLFPCDEKKNCFFGSFLESLFLFQQSRLAECAYTFTGAPYSNDFYNFWSDAVSVDFLIPFLRLRFFVKYTSVCGRKASAILCTYVVVRICSYTPPTQNGDGSGGSCRSPGINVFPRE